MTAADPDPEQRDALIELMSPDGYYSYLGLDKNKVITAAPPPPQQGGLTTTSNNNNNKVGEIDQDAVKKAYRKLSRKHHPDKGGDAETFKALARAYRVLSNPKLREQYDILGIDLDDDVTINNNASSEENGGGGGGSDPDAEKEGSSSTAQGIVHEIASTTLTGIIQLGVRTGM